MKVLNFAQKCLHNVNKISLPEFQFETWAHPNVFL